MIFATVGTQLPFDRLVGALDQQAGQSSEEFIIQTGPSRLKLEYATGFKQLDPERFERFVEGARLLVAHAGIGSLLTASAYGKPLIIVPRRKSLGEHRNEHQLATARQFQQRIGVHIAWQVSDLGPLLIAKDLMPLEQTGAKHLQPLLDRIRTFI
ncbi:MAG: glycosyltransferase [Pseudomonadota bacterium]